MIISVWLINKSAMHKRNMRSKFKQTKFRLEFLLPLLFYIFHSRIRPAESAELMQTFEIKESSPAGTVVGTIGNDNSGNLVIGERGSDPPKPPYLIVPEEGFDEIGGRGNDLIINEQTGEIRTKNLLDRELTSAYVLNAIPLNGDNIKVVINVTDINDNTPTFVEARKDGSMDMDIPENIPPGTIRRLPPALDKDLGVFTTQQYEITGGNVDNSFDVKFRRQPITGVLELDLIVNGNLDRERISMYTLQIVAIDGGTPPRTGSLTLRVHVQDLNDSPPLFSKQRYFTTNSEDTPIGGSVLRVSATDADAKGTANSRITYSINRKQSDLDRTFSIEPTTGLIVLSRKLNFEQARVHEIVVVARDGGEVPQETSAFVTVRVSEGNGQGYYDNSIVNSDVSFYDIDERKPTNYHEKTKYFTSQVKDISLKYLLGNNGGGIPEDILTNSEFAQIILPPGWSTVSNVVATLDDASSKMFSVKGSSRDQIFLSIKSPIDYEVKNHYQVHITITDPSYAKKPLQKVFTIPVIDINDNTPLFNQTTYKSEIMESADIGFVVANVHATDADQGRNGQISYSLRYQDEKSSMFSDWFEIDPRTGTVSTASLLDCELESNPQVIVVASDNGSPNIKSSTSTLSVTIKDVNDNVPLFEQSFYEANLSEDEVDGKCFLTIKATDQDCGANGTILYSLQKADTDIFEINSSSGKLCLKSNGQGNVLDREQRESFSFIAVAKDQGGLSASALIAVNVIDINDNSPVFLPTDYSSKISWNSKTGKWNQDVSSTILSIKATDVDERGPNSDITYEIIDGNDEALFSLDQESGSLRIVGRHSSQPTQRISGRHVLLAQAHDGAGRKSEIPAKIEINIASEEATPFESMKLQYEFNVKEDVSPYSQIGRIPIASSQYVITILQSSYSGYFSIDSKTGIIRTESRLDYETHPEVLLNLKIEDTETFKSFNAQLLIHLDDVNDNAPEFPSRVAIASVTEDYPSRKVIYICKATDADSGPDGEVTYSLKQNSNDLFFVDSQSGSVWLTNGGLDYEVATEHYLVIEAEDNGIPKLKTTMKLIVHVHDINDNPPVFDKISYTVAMSESVTVGSSIATIR